MERSPGYVNVMASSSAAALPHMQPVHHVAWVDRPIMSSPSPDGTTPTSASSASDGPPLHDPPALAPAPLDWEAHKQVIKDLYMGQNLNLSEVVERMRAYNFHAT